MASEANNKRAQDIRLTFHFAIPLMPRGTCSLRMRRSASTCFDTYTIHGERYILYEPRGDDASMASAISYNY